MGTIVVGVDGSAGGAQALSWAVREAKLREWKLTAVMVWEFLDQRHADPDVSFDPQYQEADAAAALDAYVTRALGDDEAGAVERRVVCDLAAPALLAAASGASLLVVGARGLGGFRGLLLGSVSQHCIRHAPCPIAVVRDTTGTSLQLSPEERIVVGTDGSDGAQKALRWALDEARARHAGLDVVEASNTPDRQSLDTAIDGDDTDGVPVRRLLVRGGATAALLETASGASLVVVGSRGRGGFAGLLLGSVSQQVAQHAECPVVVVPAS